MYVPVFNFKFQIYDKEEGENSESTILESGINESKTPDDKNNVNLNNNKNKEKNNDSKKNINNEISSNKKTEGNSIKSVSNLNSKIPKKIEKNSNNINKEKESIIASGNEMIL